MVLNWHHSRLDLYWIQSGVNLTPEFLRCRPRGLVIWPGGYLVQKTLRGCAANMGSKINLLVYEWPLIKCKIWYMNGSIFQNLPKFEAKIGSNLRKFWKKLVILFIFWLKIEPIGIWMGYFFLKKWYLYGSTFKIPWRHILPKPNLSTPPRVIERPGRREKGVFRRVVHAMHRGPTLTTFQWEPRCSNHVNFADQLWVRPILLTRPKGVLFKAEVQVYRILSEMEMNLRL